MIRRRKQSYCFQFTSSFFKINLVKIWPHNLIYYYVAIFFNTKKRDVCGQNIS